MDDDKECPQCQQKYKEGYLAALHRFAWWKDGVQYVGCGYYTLKEAIKKFEELEREKDKSI